MSVLGLTFRVKFHVVAPFELAPFVAYTQEAYMGLNFSLAHFMIANKEFTMDFMLEFEQETDGCWIAEIPELLRVLAERIASDQQAEDGT